MKITTQEVVEALTARNRGFILCHECSLCGYPCGYHFSGAELYYDHGCDCTRGGYSRSQRSPDDLADWINMQSNPQAAERIWKSIVGEPAKATDAA